MLFMAKHHKALEFSSRGTQILMSFHQNLLLLISNSKYYLSLAH